MTLYKPYNTGRKLILFILKYHYCTITTLPNTGIGDLAELVEWWKRWIFHLQYRAAAWIGYYWLFPDIVGYFLYSFKIYELRGGKNVWK